jgi:predicted transposase/invertase (TIGR01784 family)
MASYMDPTTDFGFKRLFGQEDSKEILKRFLFDVLRLPYPIADLSYIPAEQLPPAPDDRRGIFDIYCVDTSGRRFFVEMQRGRQTYFRDRIIYYSTFPITHQAEKGAEWQFRLEAVYCLAILHFPLDTEPHYLRRVQLADIERCTVFYDKLTYVLIELPKFDQAVHHLTTAADKWVYLLKNLPQLEEIPAELAEEPFTQAFEIAAKAALSPEERWQYEVSLDRARTEYATLTTAREEGVEEGMERGREAAKLEIARAMLAQGLDVTLICQVTGLSEHDLAELAGGS